MDSATIRLTNQGPGLITDNVIRSQAGAVGPAIEWAGLLGADVVTLGNTFTVADPVRSNGRWIGVDDRVVARSTLSLVEPALPGPLPYLDRRVFHVVPGADARALQAAVDAAAALSGTRPVVHIPHGVYAIAQTVTVPASDVQITGDGYGTILRWSGTDSGPVMRFEGPTTATLREIQIDGARRAHGIIIDNVDQVGSRVYMQGVQLRSGALADLSIEELDHTHVQLEDIGYAYSPDGVAIRVAGGPLSAAGEATAGRTNVFSGASSGNRMSYDVSRGATVLVRDLWYESGAGPGFAKVHGRATLTVDGVRVSSPVNQAPAAFEISDLDGTVSILATHIDDRIVISGNGRNAKVLGMAIFCEQGFADCFLNTASPKADVILLSSRQISRLPGNRSIGATDVGTVDPEFIRTMLGHARGELPAVLESLPAGTTDARMFRVWVTGGLNNVTLSAR